MITHKPSPLDFEKQSIEYLVEFIGDICEHDLEDYYKYYQVALKNALTLMFLALENQLKKKICEISPLLLLSEKPSEWGSYKKDKPFYKFHTRSFDDLLTLYIEITNQKLPDNVLNQLESLRNKRNLITHTFYDTNLHPKDLLNDFAIIVKYVWGAGIWWTQYKKYITSYSEFGSYNKKEELAWFSHTIESMIKIHGLKRTGELLGIDFQARRYYCPDCYIYVNVDADNYSYKHAVLMPNTSDSTNIICGSCQKEFEVKRLDCSKDDCSGNVIYELKNSIYDDSNLCLTCGAHAQIK